MATYDASGELYASFTNMGGFMQPQGHVQLMINMIEVNQSSTILNEPKTSGH